jgi:hypothetical protein
MDILLMDNSTVRLPILCYPCNDSTSSERTNMKIFFIATSTQTRPLKDHTTSSVFHSSVFLWFPTGEFGGTEPTTVDYSISITSNSVLP